MLFTPLWKRILIWGVVALGIAGAIPNLNYANVERHNDALVALDAVTAQNDDLTPAEATALLTPEQQADKALWPGFLP